MSDGGITVTKTSTGSLLLQDIQVMVHHQIPTYIPADKALNSTDLHRAIGSKAIFQMLNTIHTAKPQDSKAVLEDENRQLREALMKSTQQSTALQQSMNDLAQQVGVLAAAVTKMGSQQVILQAAPNQQASEVVGGEVPMFLPDTEVPSGESVQLQVQEVLSEGDGVSDARSRLRQLRKGQTG